MNHIRGSLLEILRHESTPINWYRGPKPPLQLSEPLLARHVRRLEGCLAGVLIPIPLRHPARHLDFRHRLFSSLTQV